MNLRHHDSGEQVLTILRERLIPTKMTGSINATYSQGLTDV